MAIIRIFSLSWLLTSLTVFSSITHTTHNPDLTTWQSTYLDVMSSDELQLIGNFLYISYSIAIIEAKIHQLTTPISQLHQSIRTKIAHYQDATQELTTLQTLLTRLSCIMGTRTIYMETLKTCNLYYEKTYSNQNNHTSLINQALESIQLDAQNKLLLWANEKLPEINNQLKKSSQSISFTQKDLEGISFLYKKMSEGTLPFSLSEQQEPLKSLFIFDVILRNHDAYLTIAEKNINNFNETHDCASHIITIGMDVYRQYYEAVYNNLINATTHNQQYASTMFGMYDILPAEYQSPLPHPDHVFEHTLKTTKLYTKTEFLQQ